jgi:multiple antibiotic resistance protein
MLSLSDYIKTFIALLVIVNPIGTIPLFVVMCGTETPMEQQRIAKHASIAVAIVLTVSALLGQIVLDFFGITIASFKVGGAILILLMAISMMQVMPMRTRQTPEEAEEAIAKDSVAVVPLAIPLLAGPGAISTTIIYATDHSGVGHLAMIVLCCVAVALLTWLALRVATPITDLLGKTGINIAVRIMGLLLAAVAVEIFVSGLTTLLPALR